MIFYKFRPRLKISIISKSTAIIVMIKFYSDMFMARIYMFSQSQEIINRKLLFKSSIGVDKIESCCSKGQLVLT